MDLRFVGRGGVRVRPSLGTNHVFSLAAVTLRTENRATEFYSDLFAALIEISQQTRFVRKCESHSSS
jgi:hypothetical protein